MRTKFNPNHDAKGRFASGGGAKASPVVRAWADKKFAIAEHADAFVKWFGDSKVVNDAGEPLTVYHGTNSSFDEFRGDDEGKFGQERFHMFDSDPEYPGQIGNSVMPAYLSIKNPLISDSISGYDIARGTFTKKELISQGYDGLKTKEGWWVAFHPTQIKSTTSNAGTFDPESAKISKSADLVEKFNPHHDSLGRFASGGGGGAKKKNTGGIESETTKEILAGIQKDSAKSADEVLSDFAGEFEFWAQRYSGEGDFKHTAAEAKEKFDAAMEKADYVIVFDAHKPIGDPESEATPSLQEVLGSDPSPRIKNRFEANTTTVEQPDSHRLSYERGTFGDAMDKVPIGDKPKYGTIRFEGDHQAGMCSHYGTSAIVLNKEAIKSRTTITPYDTSENAGFTDAFKKEQGIKGLASSAEHPYEALTNNPHAIRAAGYPRAFIEHLEKGVIAGGSGNLRNEANDYIEAQVFGSLPMNSSIVKKIVVYDGTAGANWYRSRANENNRFSGSSEPDLPMLTREEHYAPMIALSKRTGIPIEFVED